MGGRTRRVVFCSCRIVSCVLHVVCCMLNGVCAVCVACQTDRGAQRETGTPLAKMLTGRMPKPGEEGGGAGVGGGDGRVLQQLLCIRTGAYVYINNAG